LYGGGYRWAGPTRDGGRFGSFIGKWAPVKNGAIEALRAAVRSPLRDEQQAYAQISDAVQTAGIGPADEATKSLEAWVYTLALIYTHQTGLMPAFSNCENETRFERFVFALPPPPHAQLTRNRLKSTIRRLDLKNNPEFSRDLIALGSKWPISGKEEFDLPPYAIGIFLFLSSGMSWATRPPVCAIPWLTNQAIRRCNLLRAILTASDRQTAPARGAQGLFKSIRPGETPGLGRRNNGSGDYEPHKFFLPPSISGFYFHRSSLVY
jgi:hypothetical protein